MEIERFAYYRFQPSGRYFKIDKQTHLFYVLENDGRWTLSGWAMTKFYDAAYDYEEVTGQQALAAAKAMGGRMKEIFLTSSPCIPLINEPVLNPQNGFVELLRHALPDHLKVLTVCSDPDAPERTDYYAGEIAKAFAAAGMPFEEHVILDRRNARKVEQLVAWADLIVLSGGHVPTQNAFFKEIFLREHLIVYTGVILGISAGSMNAADRVYAQPERNGEAIDPGYRRFLPGLGLTNLNILPHYNMNKDEMLDGLRIYEDIAVRDSRGKRFLILPDGSFVHIVEDETRICGEGCWLADGEFENFSEE